jgi:hypothetical protein
MLVVPINKGNHCAPLLGPTATERQGAGRLFDRCGTDHGVDDKALDRDRRGMFRGRFPAHFWHMKPD